jgi:WD40-like Beta Propeller Repeat
MKKLLFLGLLATVLTSVFATAQSAWDGTWKADLSQTQLPTKPDVYLLKDGMYECKTCVPPIKVKADGEDQPVSGHPYYDTLSMKIVDDRTIEETDKKNGKTVTTSKTMVSPDGKTATFEFSDSSATNADPVTGKGEMLQVAKGPAGSHAASGSWSTTKLENMSDNGLTITFKTDGDSLTMSTLTGQGYTAKLDGTEAPFVGDPGTSSVSVKRINKNTFEETDKRDGKVISVNRLSISPDGKIMTYVSNDKLHGTTTRFIANKQ